MGCYIVTLLYCYIVTMYIGKIETGKSYKKIIILFILISIGLIVFVTYASFSRAKITLIPKEETFGVDFKVRVQKEIKEEVPKKEEEVEVLLPEAEIILGKVLEEEKEETKKITDIPLKEVEEKAKGKVTIYNNRDKDQPLRPKTQLLSDNGILFRTDQRVVIPAHGAIEVGVTADQPGKQGNIEPTHFTIVKIWKHWQKDIYAESKEPMTGGTREAKVVTQEVIDQTKDKVAQDLYDQVLKEWQEGLVENEKILEDSMFKEIVSSKALVKPDTETEEFDMTVKVHLKALTFSEKSLYDRACTKLKDKVPQDKEFISVKEDSFSYKIENLDLEKGMAELTVHLEGSMIAKLSVEVFDKEKLIGKDEYEVKRYFEQFEDVASCEVGFTPFWTKSVPSLKDHIEIVITR